ncbi:MAG: signal recognition particle-docking protein FtsY [Bacteroidales bacterium OttesenSCG-928-I14]|jgi:fused signal recognition particle receptor|nr:signal recognition particle-docking protein FtsY [Bacteroidales bacterium OttesenSCG-928-I14]
MGIFDFLSNSNFRDEKKFLSKSLSKTRRSFFDKLAKFVIGESKISDGIIDSLEEILITSDVGVETTLKIIKRVESKVLQCKCIDPNKVVVFLKEEIVSIFQDSVTANSENFLPFHGIKPYIIMVVGVNGVGKTTTVAKLAYFFKKKGAKVFLGAADTFRAAAVEQLVLWNERIGASLVKRNMGVAPSSVAYATLTSAVTNDADVVIIDTAGRLHNKINLMNELASIKNAMKKVIFNAPHEILLTLDASIGQNAYNQALGFSKATEITALAITKLDGTARGGVVIGISDQLKVPVKYIGIGEGLCDLQIFRGKEFVDSLFENIITVQ